MNVEVDILNGFTRETLSSHIVRRLHEGHSVAQADIDLLEVGGERFVLKDFHARPFMVRRFWGRKVISREMRFYKRLKGIEGIPRVLKRLDDEAFIMDYVEGMPLSLIEKGALPQSFFTQLRRLVTEMHGRGVTHGDLRQKNILVSVEGAPFLIDFAGAFCLKGRGNFLTRFLFRRLRNVDELTLLKQQDKLLPETLTPEEAKRLENVPWYLRLGRFLKKRIYKPFKRATRKRRWKR